MHCSWVGWPVIWTPPAHLWNLCWNANFPLFTSKKRCAATIDLTREAQLLDPPCVGKRWTGRTCPFSFKKKIFSWRFMALRHFERGRWFIMDPPRTHEAWQAQYIFASLVVCVECIFLPFGGAVVIGPPRSYFQLGRWDINSNV